MGCTAILPNQNRVIKSHTHEIFLYRSALGGGAHLLFGFFGGRRKRQGYCGLLGKELFALTDMFGRIGVLIVFGFPFVGAEFGFCVIHSVG